MKNETKWSIDQEHSEIVFKVKHLMIANVRGTLKIFDASIYTIGKDFTTAVIDLWIDPSSINTGNAKRDEHLKNVDFFDVQNHKQITFASSIIGKPDSEGNHKLFGDLTIKGVSKYAKLNVRFREILNDRRGNEKAGFTVTGKINRSDWGLTWNTTPETGGLMVSDEVVISCEVELTNAGEEKFIMELVPEAYESGVLLLQ